MFYLLFKCYILTLKADVSVLYSSLQSHKSRKICLSICSRKTECLDCCYHIQDGSKLSTADVKNRIGLASASFKTQRKGRGREDEMDWPLDGLLRVKETRGLPEQHGDGWRRRKNGTVAGWYSWITACRTASD